MNVTEYASLITKEITDTLTKVSPEEGEKLTDMILAAKKIFVAGAGRSGMAARAFSMRLMHMGFESYVCGETITPNLEVDDLFLVVSGSGSTGSLVSMTQKAEQIGARIATVTICPEGSIGRMTDLAVEIPAPTPKARVENKTVSVQPMGSLFEQCAFIFFDSVILRLMEKRGISSDKMFTRHANLE